MQPRSTELQQVSFFRLQGAARRRSFTPTPTISRTSSIISPSPASISTWPSSPSRRSWCTNGPPLPASLPVAAWDEVDAGNASGVHWEMLVPSEVTAPTALLAQLANELRVTRRTDPLTALLEINHGFHRAIAYDAASTNVDSPIDEALEHRRGVCQDYAHIMLALVRNYLQIPCRYVSGYLFHSRADTSADGASHAWLDVWLPGLGWVGFDPTNDMVVGERHIEVAVGRDYQDVPPTRGMFKGNAGSELSVGVRVRMLLGGVARCRVTGRGNCRDAGLSQHSAEASGALCGDAGRDPDAAAAVSRWIERVLIDAWPRSEFRRKHPG